MSSNLKRNLFVIFTALFIFSLFMTIAFFEYKNNIEDQKNIVKNQEDILVTRINSILNYSIGGAEGVVSFIRTYPDLNQDDFGDYVSKVLDPNSEVVSHLVAIKDTTIAFSYPLEGNESGIGIDLATIEDQREQILKVKNENVSLLVGPVELVEGGVRLINRMPIFIDQQDMNTYWGQLSVIIRYEALLSSAGINELSATHYIRIRQVSYVDDTENIIYSNHSEFSDETLISTVDVPNGEWIIHIEPKEGFTEKSTFFYITLIIGFVFSSVIAYILKYIMQVNNNLNKIVDVRTEHIHKMNLQLEESLEELKTTQDQLIEKEKMAALGSLVAGVAHEINTPLGVCITANTYVEELVDTTSKKLEENMLKKSELINNLARMKESVTILNSNLYRSSKLVKNFKLLAADQHFEEFKLIYLKDFVEYVTHSLSPTYRHTEHTIHSDIKPNIWFMTYPGGLSQVFTNLIINSFTHGFTDDQPGMINIEAYEDKDYVYIDYYDNGCGLDEGISNQIFQPFFTTKRNIGNTGLGLHIVYNIVHQQLNGKIKLIQDSKVGLHFRITLPNIKSDSSDQNEATE